MKAAAPTSPTLSPAVKSSDWLGIRTHGDPELEKLRRCAEGFLDDLAAGVSTRWLTLLGDSGTGKTHSATAIWREARRRLGGVLDPSSCQYQTRIIYWPQFIDRLRSGEGYEELRDMQRWPLLIIDDIGAERDTTGFAAEKMNTLLGCRTGRWTVLTTNVAWEEWERREARIASRMIRDGSVVCRVRTVDYCTRDISC